MNTKNVIVTGATGGIGQGIAEYLANKDYRLILTSRTEERLQSLQKSVKSLHTDTVQCQSVDFDDPNTITDYQSWLEKGKQKIDGIVLITPRPNLKNNLFPSSKDWLALFQNAFVGPLEFLKSTLSHFGKNGKIVIISGITSIQSMDGHSMHGVLRTMWLSQAKSMSQELGPKGICVNTVSPGGVLTKRGLSRMQKKAKSKNISFNAQYAESVQNVPLRKYAQPEDIASTVKFFLSNRSDHITGANVACDGGFTRSY